MDHDSRCAPWFAPGTTVGFVTHTLDRVRLEVATHGIESHTQLCDLDRIHITDHADSGLLEHSMCVVDAGQRG